MPEMHLPVEADRGIELDAGMKQVLALLTAYCREKRVVLRASDSGMLWVGSPELADIIVFTATGGTKAWQGDDIACSEVAVIAGLSNGDRLWTRPNKVATSLNAWPLDKSEIFGFTLHNLNQLHVTIQTTDDIAVIAYTE
jgi:hypothetical protein